MARWHSGGKVFCLTTPDPQRPIDPELRSLSVWSWTSSSGFLPPAGRSISVSESLLGVKERVRERGALGVLWWSACRPGCIQASGAKLLKARALYWQSARISDYPGCIGMKNITGSYSERTDEWIRVSLLLFFLFKYAVVNATSNYMLLCAKPHHILTSVVQ